MGKRLDNFVKVNVNPNDNLAGDCVVRSLTKASGSSWEETFKGLCELAYEMKYLPNADEVWKEYARSIGFEYKALPKVEKGGKRPIASELSKQLGSGNYILRVSKHLVASVDGKYYDSWDSGKKPVYGYWEKVVN